MGFDADTLGAVTGMLAGRKYGLKGQMETPQKVMTKQQSKSKND